MTMKRKDKIRKYSIVKLKNVVVVDFLFELFPSSFC